MSLQRPDRIEWAGAPTFAEVAEALDVPTTSIMVVQAKGAIGRSPDLVVLYSEREDEPTILSYVELRRDADGILRPTSPPIPRPGLWESIVARAEGLDADLPSG